LGLLDSDPDGYVRYGAIRSITELSALASPELRKAISEEIAARAETLGGQPKILGELRACLLMDVSMAPEGWLEFVARVVRAMFIATDSKNERDLWRQCLNSAEELYGAQARPIHGNLNG
jgi:hypothetical protein